MKAKAKATAHCRPEISFACTFDTLFSFFLFSFLLTVAHGFAQ